MPKRRSGLAAVDEPDAHEGALADIAQAVRDRTHWKSQEIRPRDPVLLGLCAQLELDDAILRARLEQGKNGTAPQPPGTGPQPAFEDELGA